MIESFLLRWQDLDGDFDGDLEVILLLRTGVPSFFRGELFSRGSAMRGRFISEVCVLISISLTYVLIGGT